MLGGKIYREIIFLLCKECHQESCDFDDRYFYAYIYYMRKNKYKIIETKKYCVDESFPSVTVNSFKGDRLPDHVIKFSYTIDLAGISGTKII